MNRYLIFILLFLKSIYSYLLKEFFCMLNISGFLLYVLQNLFLTCGIFFFTLLGLLMYRYLKLQCISLNACFIYLGFYFTYSIWKRYEITIQFYFFFICVFNAFSTPSLICNVALSATNFSRYACVIFSMPIQIYS